jgi:hypothetical protein
MTFGAQLFSRLYAALLRLYPCSFRAEFGAEMEAVFAEALAGTAAQGWASLASLLLRELRDWPGALLRAHWYALKKEKMMGGNMESTVFSSDVPPTLEDRHAPVPWREALLAGLPHALVALIILAVGVGRPIMPSPRQVYSVIEIVLGATFILSVVVAMVVAWRRGWPRWSASWFAYAFLLLMFPLGSVLDQWKVPLGSWRLMLLLPGVYFRLLVPLLLVAMLYASVLRNRLKVLLIVLSLMPLSWGLVLEFTSYPIRLVVMFVAWLCVALVAVLIARSGSARIGVWMVLALTLVVGLAYTYIRTYYVQFPPDAPEHYRLPPTLLDWLNRFALVMLATSVLVLEPLLVRRLWVLGQRSGAMGVLGFRLALVGLMLLLAADMTASWWFASGSGIIKLIWGYGAAKGLWLNVLAYLAILFYFSGVVTLGTAVVQAGPVLEEIASLLLVFALIIMPLIAALPIVYDLWDIRTIPKIWGYVVGLPWLSLGTWLVTRRSTGRVSRAAV